MLRFFPILVLISACMAQDQASAVRLIRSLSGPSGKIVNNEYVLDERRVRFVFPQDRTMVVTFQWDAAPGDHTMTGIWKGPDGRVVYISPDVRVQTQTRELRGYWISELYSTSQNGFWTLEMRVDGQPAGSHNFEFVIPAQPAAPAPVSVQPSVGDVYRASIGSVVWIHKLDASGRRVDVSQGFVIGKDKVATAFQAIDSAVQLDVEFEGGRTVRTADIWGQNRLQDWAVVKADTKDAPILTPESPAGSYVGERLLLFNVEQRMNRAFGGVDISGSSSSAPFGPRIQFSPSVPIEAAGGPLITTAGKVAGVVGGSDRPGFRYDANASTGFVFLTEFAPHSATPIGLIGEMPATPSTLEALEKAGILTSRVVSAPNLLYGSLTKGGSKDLSLRPSTVSEFSHGDTIAVITQWAKREKQGKGTIGVKLYDMQNRMIFEGGRKQVSLNEDMETRLSVALSVSGSPKTAYRVDVSWNGVVAWRSYFSIKD